MIILKLKQKMINPTHQDLKDLKKQFKIKNSDIAEIVGLTVDSVKTMTQPKKELPSWAKAMIFVWKKKATIKQ
jgi:DNA-binding transcriptional regulator YiaG